ncbi:cyclodeaminase/cyclohydrolase family protein [Metallumcola ferriviriculae]|uniref:Cyclodeaminase/cyclohydrolase family protein n=1 Tax=Metallumcola ferriviriculae TaxID=3039180 RepID=A0AAU0UP13_9FIRM|nr:cyclodeaminase/cyclohydrolase family protein [Desulfitibacteraceae bacterium MK1]
MDLTHISISSYLNELNSGKTSANAGSTLAITGALGVSLLGMACELTLKHVKIDGFHELTLELDRLSETFLELGQRDMEVFTDALQKDENAKIKAIESPLNVAGQCLPIISKCLDLRHQCHAMVEKDVEVSLLLLSACCEGNILLAVDDLKLVQGETREEFEKKISSFKNKLDTLKTKMSDHRNISHRNMSLNH